MNSTSSAGQPGGLVETPHHPVKVAALYAVYVPPAFGALLVFVMWATGWGDWVMYAGVLLSCLAAFGIVAVLSMLFSVALDLLGRLLKNIFR